MICVCVVCATHAAPAERHARHRLPSAKGSRVARNRSRLLRHHSRYSLHEYENFSQNTFSSNLTAPTEKNVARVRINPDRTNTSTDGFLLNFTAVLLQLCAPFITKMEKVRRSIDHAGHIAVIMRWITSFLPFSRSYPWWIRCSSRTRSASTRRRRRSSPSLRMRWPPGSIRSRIPPGYLHYSAPHSTPQPRSTGSIAIRATSSIAIAAHIPAAAPVSVLST